MQEACGDFQLMHRSLWFKLRVTHFLEKSFFLMSQQKTGVSGMAYLWALRHSSTVDRRCGRLFSFFPETKKKKLCVFVFVFEVLFFRFGDGFAGSAAGTVSPAS
jgi:hypothetical protein